VQYGFLLILLASIVIAGVRGGAPERWGAATLAVMTIVQIAGFYALGSRFGEIDWVATAVDIIGFAAFTAIALFTRRIWPLWASALQLFSLTTHFFRALDIHIHPGVYWLTKSAPTFGICLILIVATAMHRRRVRTSGSDVSWTVWRDGSAHAPSTPTIRRF
jgi:hypothetical protein